MYQSSLFYTEYVIMYSAFCYCLISLMNELQRCAGTDQSVLIFILDASVLSNMTLQERYGCFDVLQQAVSSNM